MDKSNNIHTKLLSIKTATHSNKRPSYKTICQVYVEGLLFLMNKNLWLGIAVCVHNLCPQEAEAGGLQTWAA
jgi:hypothetical protein